MSYFVAEGQTYSVDAMRSSADVLSDRMTLNFTQKGTYYIRVDNPQIGEVFGQLNDVTVVKDGAGGGIIQDVAQAGILSVHQLSTTVGGTYTLSGLGGGTGSSELDEVLGGMYPTFTNNSSFSKLVMPPGQSSEGYLPEFYLEVDGGPGVFDEVFGPYGLDAPNDGRVLITRGAIGGQRDAAWGNWLDEVTISGENPNQPETPTIPPGEPITQQEFEQSRQNALQDLQEHRDAAVKAMERLDGVRFELEAQQERLQALSDEQVNGLAVKALEGLSLAGTWAQNFIPGKLPASLLLTTYESLKAFGSTDELVNSTSDLFSDPSLSNLQKFDASLTSWLVDAKGYESALGKWFGAVQTAKQSAEFFSSISEHLDDRALINDNIERTQQRILDLKEQETQLNSTLQQLYNQTTNRGSEAVQIHEAGAFVEFIAPQSKAVLAFSQGNTFQVNGNEDGRDVAVSLMDNAQKVTFKSGSGVVDGHNSANDTVVLIGNRSDFIETNAGAAGAVFERAGAKVIVTDVDRVQFSDGTLAFDIDSGDKAGLAFRTYQAAFDRAPDANGLAFHIKNLDAGQSFNDMATGFINSPEFKALYGENTSDDTFINALYHNVLGREPDSEGRQYYLNRLAQDPGERDSILIGFAESPENIALTGFSTQSGVWFPGA